MPGAALGDQPASASVCPIERPVPLRSAPRPRAPAAPGPTFMRADAAKSLDRDVTELEGNAEVTRDGTQINADYLRYDRRENRVEATGNVTVTDPAGAQYTTRETQMDLDTHAGSAEAGTYRLPGQLGRGDMERVEFIDRHRTRLSAVRYTTCPENRDDWFLRARWIDLDTARNVGVARNMTLDLFGLPVLYLPYFRFPLSDERQSGFLVPQIGYASRTGTVLAAPYYFNLAPNYDATLTPRLMTERGVQLQTEFRYLGRTLNGRLEAEYLPDDRLADRDRAAGTFVHSQAFNPYWRGFVDLRRVSDRDYLSDFGDHLGVTSVTHLPQNAEVGYRGSIWSFTARASDYQIVDRSIGPAVEPYARLPQLLFAGNSGSTPHGAQYGFAGELVNFEHDVLVTGQRAYLNPSVRLPLARVYGFLTPELGLRHIAYSLNEPPPALPGPDNRPSVTAPYAALDTGLYFDREFEIGGGYFDQTLEPRLYYLYVPFRAQDDLPDFDTSVPDFSFANLFRTNRFIGGDRIGDANQLTVALTTRVIDQDSGTERVRASIGRIYYFDERRVNLPAGTVETGASDIAAEGVAQLAGNWHARASTQWAAEGDRTVRSSFFLQHQPAADRIVNLGYRLVRDQLEQVDLSAEWPVGARWTLRGRSLYSLRDIDRGNVDSFIGVEYRHCCWAVRFYAARGIVQTVSGAEETNRFLLEFELAGLSRAGRGFESPLQQGVFTFPASPPAGAGPIP